LKEHISLDRDLTSKVIQRDGQRENFKERPDA